MEFIGLFFIFVGVAFCLLGVAGLLRFPDVFTRIHAAGKVTTLGVLFVLLGGVLIFPDILPRAILLAFFLLMTAPVASNAIAGAAHVRDDPLYERDDLQRDKVDIGYDTVQGSDRMLGEMDDLEQLGDSSG